MAWSLFAALQSRDYATYFAGGRNHRPMSWYSSGRQTAGAQTTLKTFFELQGDTVFMEASGAYYYFTVAVTQAWLYPIAEFVGIVSVPGTCRTTT